MFIFYVAVLICVVVLLCFICFGGFGFAVVCWPGRNHSTMFNINDIKLEILRTRAAQGLVTCTRAGSDHLPPQQLRKIRVKIHITGICTRAVHKGRARACTRLARISLLLNIVLFFVCRAQRIRGSDKLRNALDSCVRCYPLEA